MKGAGEGGKEHKTWTQGSARARNASPRNGRLDAPSARASARGSAGSALGQTWDAGRGKSSKRAGTLWRNALHAGTTPPPASDRASTFAGHASRVQTQLLSGAAASRAVSIGKPSSAVKNSSRMGRVKSAASPPPTLPYRPMSGAADVVCHSMQRLSSPLHVALCPPLLAPRVTVFARDGPDSGHTRLNLLNATDAS